LLSVRTAWKIGCGYRSTASASCPNPIFVFSLPFHIPSRSAAGMPAPERNHVQVVRCKGIGCGPNVPTPVEVRVRTGSIAVLCPVCLERRSYIVSTEVFMGSPSWEVVRALQGPSVEDSNDKPPYRHWHTVCVACGKVTLARPCKVPGDIDPIEHNPVIRCQHRQDTRQYLDKDCSSLPYPRRDHLTSLVVRLLWLPV
jgi:hypothetical protein